MFLFGFLANPLLKYYVFSSDLKQSHSDSKLEMAGIIHEIASYPELLNLDSSYNEIHRELYLYIHKITSFFLFKNEDFYNKQ